MTDPAGEADAGLADLHSHLVPGVDDGARTADEALEGVDRLVGAGVRHILTTPHLDASLEGNARSLERRLGEVSAAWAAVRVAVAERHPDVELGLGFEVLLDVPDPPLDDPRLRLAGSRFVLVEWPHLSLPRGTVRTLAALRERGLVPVVAHPERYGGLGKGLARAAEWRRVGACLQVNHGSLHGRYGREAKAHALDLLRRGWVDLLSSDFHGRANLRTYVDATRAWFAELDAEDTFMALASRNPLRVFRDEEPMPVSPLDVPRSALDRIRSFLHKTGGTR